VFAKLLYKKLPLSRGQLPIEIQQQIDIESIRIQKTRNGKIDLTQGKGTLSPMQPKGDYRVVADELEPLSQIIKELNDTFGTDFTDQDKVFIQLLESKLAEDQALKSSVKINPPENARLTFDLFVNDKLQEMIDKNFRFYKMMIKAALYENRQCSRDCKTCIPT
jgi:type I restriction enzyme R subunit